MQIAGHTPVDSSSTTPENLSFQQEGAFDVQLRDDLFLTSEGFDADVLKMAQTAARSSRGIPVGMAEFRDVHVHLPTGMIVDTVGNACWQGSLLNWNKPVLQREIIRQFGRQAAGNRLRLSDHLLRDCQTLDSAILIQSAGYSIYGHWLLDFLPRINRVHDSLYAQHKVLCQPQKEWTRALFNLFMPDCHFADGDIVTDFVQVKRLLVPTMARTHGALEENTVRKAWEKLDGLLNHNVAAPVSGRRLCVSRQKLKGKKLEKRQIINIPDIERRAAEAGFEMVYPETLSFAEQRQIFSEAAVVVGECGSALHNAIFCRPGARLGVISNGRINTNHAMIANICGLRITYMSASPIDDTADGPSGYSVDPGEFDAMLGNLFAGR